MKFRSLICLILIVCVAFSGGIQIFASNIEFEPEHRYKKFEEAVRTAVTKLVEEGKLSKDKADMIFQVLKEKESKRISFGKAKKYGYVNKLVSDGIINEQEAELIRNKIRHINEERLDIALKGLVDKGVFDNNKSREIKEYIRKAVEERIQMHEKLKDMNEADRKAYIKSVKKNRKSMLQKLVEDGIINEKQAEELKKAIFEQ
ncbi:MAG: hypothetical protein ACOZCL_02910 [Bacillota bacterium]